MIIFVMKTRENGASSQMLGPTTSVSTSSPTRPAHLRQANARTLFQLVRANDPCSKADLVRLSGLSAPTVTCAISHLENLGLVESIGDGESTGGRRPELLRINASHGYVAAADIGGTRLRMMLADLNGSVLSSWSIILTKNQKTPQGVCGLIHEGLKKMCQEAGISPAKIFHLTAGAPGITNVTEGIVLSAPNLLDWVRVPLRTMLQRETKIPVIIDNDTNLAAVGEHWRGAAAGISNFVFIAIGTGVGAGIYLGGQLHHGAHWSAGEIGYLGTHGEKREPMQINQPGQLERVIGGHGVEIKWAKMLQQAGIPRDSEQANLRASQIFDLARDGDAAAVEVIQYAASILADTITDISLLLDPAIVVLGGGVGSHPELCRLTQGLIQKHEVSQPQLRSSSLGTQAQLFGALFLSLKATEASLLS